MGEQVLKQGILSAFVKNRYDNIAVNFDIEKVNLIFIHKVYINDSYHFESEPE